MFDWLRRAFRSRISPRQWAEAPTQPAWERKFSVCRESIVLFSPLTPENMFRGQAQASLAAVGPIANSDEGSCQPIAGAENSVPWPLPPVPGARVLTFWGSGNTTTGSFQLRRDGVLRIAASGGPFTLQVKCSDGTILRDIAALDGQTARLGLLAISEGGTYSLVVEAPVDVHWGVTVMQM